MRPAPNLVAPGRMWLLYPRRHRSSMWFKIVMPQAGDCHPRRTDCLKKASGKPLGLGGGLAGLAGLGFCAVVLSVATVRAGSPRAQAGLKSSLHLPPEQKPKAEEELFLLKFQQENDGFGRRSSQQTTPKYQDKTTVRAGVRRHFCLISCPYVSPV
jgi:hypothetical protein